MGSSSFLERYSIKKQLILTFIGILVLSIAMTIATIGVGIYWLYSKDWLHAANHYEQEIPKVRAYINQQGAELLAGKSQEPLEKVIPLDGIQYQVINLSGQVRYGSIGEPIIHGKADLITRLNTSELSNSLLSIGGTVSSVIPLTSVEGALKGAVILQYKMETSTDKRAPVILMFVVLILLFGSPFIYFALFTWLFASKFGRRINKPVRELMQASERIRKQDLDFSISYSANNEIGHLSQSFEAMRQELAQALQREWVMEQERRDMMDAIAHDFRTPMTIIQGNVELMADILPDSEQRLSRHLQVIEHNVKRVNRLIQDIHVASERDLEYFPLNLEEVDIDSYLAMKAEEIAQLCTHKHIGCEFKVQDRRQQVGTAIFLDTQRVGQVLDNIVSNSLRFAQPYGVIKLSISLLDGSIRFEISDSGAGFETKDLPFLFQKFYRGEKGQSGLGLYTARIIVEKHGGIIQANNHREGGACVTFTIDTKQRAV